MGTIRGECTTEGQVCARASWSEVAHASPALTDEYGTLVNSRLAEDRRSIGRKPVSILVTYKFLMKYPAIKIRRPKLDAEVYLPKLDNSKFFCQTAAIH
jgi:hypothetical protein